MVYEVYHTYLFWGKNPYDKYIITKRINDPENAKYEDYETCGSTEGVSYSYYPSIESAARRCIPYKTTTCDVPDTEKEIIAMVFNDLYGTHMTAKDIPNEVDIPDNTKELPELG